MRLIHTYTVSGDSTFNLSDGSTGQKKQGPNGPAFFIIHTFDFFNLYGIGKKAGTLYRRFLKNTDLGKGGCDGSKLFEGSGSFSPNSLNISLRLRFQPVGLTGRLPACRALRGVVSTRRSPTARREGRAYASESGMDDLFLNWMLSEWFRDR